ncbi:hypothetical protein [Rothia nasimurium]|nr:hypothetical protein [Rothia nasimurium]
MKLTYEQMETKAIFLAEENNRLRAALLDAQIRLGDITTTDENKEK